MSDRSTPRRRVLASAASVASLAAAAGCLEAEFEAAEHEPAPLADRVSLEEVDLPVQQRYEVAAAAIERAATAEIADRDALAAYLEEQGVPVASVGTGEAIEPEDPHSEPVSESEAEPAAVVELEFVAEERADAGFLERMGLVAGGYAALVASEYDAELLEATVLDDAGEPFGSFHVLTEWAEEYNGGTISARSYGNKPWMTTKTVPSGDL